MFLLLLLLLMMTTRCQVYETAEVTEHTGGIVCVWFTRTGPKRLRLARKCGSCASLSISKRDLSEWMQAEPIRWSNLEFSFRWRVSRWRNYQEKDQKGEECVRRPMKEPRRVLVTCVQPWTVHHPSSSQSQENKLTS